MHTIKVIAGGFVLLGAFLLGRLLGGGAPSALATAARYFIPVWLIGAAFNLWIGVSRAGYPLADEVPFFIAVFAVPAGAAGLVWWRFSRG